MNNRNLFFKDLLSARSQSPGSFSSRTTHRAGAPARLSVALCRGGTAVRSEQDLLTEPEIINESEKGTNHSVASEQNAR